MSFVQFPDFVTKDPRGVVTEIRCKVCGTLIAAVSESITETRVGRDGTRHVKVVNQFMKFPNWTELRMEFADRSAHITHGCSKCISLALTPDQLDELQNADVEEQRLELGDELADKLAARVPLRAVAIKIGEGGIL